jgi:hypothetical protein
MMPTTGFDFAKLFDFAKSFTSGAAEILAQARDRRPRAGAKGTCKSAETEIPPPRNTR